MGLVQAWTAEDGRGISSPDAYHRVTKVDHDVEQKEIHIILQIFMDKSIRDDPQGAKVHQVGFTIHNQKEGDGTPFEGRQDYDSYVSNMNVARSNDRKAAYKFLHSSGHPDVVRFNGNTVEV